MQVAALLMALGLVATVVSGASGTATTKKTRTRSGRHHSYHSSYRSHSSSRMASHSSSHSHTARHSLPAGPTPERYQEIQQALASRGYYKGTVSGTWDSDSADALKRFQADQNLPPDGKLTPLSLIAMGLGPRRSGGTPPPGPSSNSPSAPPATSAAPVTVQSNPAPAPQAPAEAH